jgi:phosphoribosylformylglycinamidine cyclo-ligase
MAHITGGGLTGNLPRVLPAGCKAVIESGSWTVPPIVTLIRENGKIAEDEMFRTFNMGIGLVLVVAREHADHCRTLLASLGETAWIIGEVKAGPRGIEYAGAR